MPSEKTAGAEQTDDSASIESLAELMQQDRPAAEPEPEPGTDSPPQRFNDLAEKLGLDVSDLYRLEVSQAEDGTPVTIETLKDFYAKGGQVGIRELEFEERRTQREAELIQAQDEIRELMTAIPERALKPEVLEKVRAKQAAQLQLERQKTLEVIPEWRDEATRTRDIEGMLAHLKQYGYPAEHLGRVTDHRQLRYIRENWLREQRIRTALNKVKAGKPNPTTGSKPAGKAPSRRPLTGVKRGNAGSALEAVFSKL